MESALTWTQFATVIGMLAAVAAIASYFFKQWQEKAFGMIFQRFDQIDRRLDGIDGKMVTKEQLRAELAEMELRLKTETPSAPPGRATT